MNRFRIPLSDKYDTWYKNPFIRLVLLAALLVVMIVICVSVLGGKAENDKRESSVVSLTEETEDASLINGASANDASADAVSDTSVTPDTANVPAGQNTENSQDSAMTAPDQSAEAAAAAVPAGADGTVPPEAADGTGAAGIMSLTDEMLASSAETGWHYTYKGMWYSMSPGLCYYNGWQTVDGQTYHFSDEGYRDVGWKRVGGQACCFDNQGVYQPDASHDKLVAFTFDDGPSQGMDMILDLCQETGARVTFFMIGVQVENGGAVIPRIMEDHCQLGNHSYTHSNMDKVSAEECAADFAKCDEFIRSFSNGPGAEVVRFPYGNISEEKTNAVGKPCILWDIDSLDWESQDAAQIVDRVHSQLSDGNIILMHDRYDATVEACRQLFPELIANGYQLVTVEELSIAKGVEMQPGAVYYNF